MARAANPDTRLVRHDILRKRQIYYILFPQTAIEIMNYTFEFCTKNENCSQSDIQELLEDVMDQEFESICDDSSIEGPYY